MGAHIGNTDRKWGLCWGLQLSLRDCQSHCCLSRHRNSASGRAVAHFSHTVLWFLPHFPSGICSNVTSPKKHSLRTGPKIVIPIPSHSHTHGTTLTQHMVFSVLLRTKQYYSSLLFLNKTDCIFQWLKKLPKIIKKSILLNQNNWKIIPKYET